MQLFTSRHYFERLTRPNCNRKINSETRRCLAVMCLGENIRRLEVTGKGVEGQDVISCKESCSVHSVNIISGGSNLRIAVSVPMPTLFLVYGLVTRTHTGISTDSVTREVVALSYSVVKEVQVTARHDVALVRRIRHWPGRRDTCKCFYRDSAKMK